MIGHSWPYGFQAVEEELPAVEVLLPALTTGIGFGIGAVS